MVLERVYFKRYFILRRQRFFLIFIINIYAVVKLRVVKIVKNSSPLTILNLQALCRPTHKRAQRFKFPDSLQTPSLLLGTFFPVSLLCLNLGLLSYHSPTHLVNNTPYAHRKCHRAVCSAVLCLVTWCVRITSLDTTRPSTIFYRLLLN
jgi:hypothetical protein